MLKQNINEISLDDAITEEIIQTKMSKSMRDLKLLLNPHVTEKGDQCTNIISVNEKRTYSLPTDKLETFFILLETCRTEKRMMHYSERQETSTISHSGIMIDFDIYQRNAERELDDESFKAVVWRVMELIGEFIDIPKKTSIHVFIIMKDKPTKMDDKTYKDGFHILIPEIQVIRGFKKYLLQEMLNKNVLNEAFESVSLIEDVASVLDKQSASNPVHFFGSSKPQRIAYPLTHIFKLTAEMGGRWGLEQYDVAAVLNGSKFGPLNLIYEMSLLYHLDTFGGKPTWLKKKTYNFKVHLETPIQLLTEKTQNNLIDEDDILENENSIDILTIGNAEAGYLKKLLSIIDVSYATTYEKWFKVICAIAHTSTHYKPLAVYFSHRRPDSWSMVELDRVWDEAIKGKGKIAKPCTKKSIEYWARTSSPQRYEEIEKENYVQILAREIYSNDGRIEHAIVAKLLKAMVGSKFVAVEAPVGYKGKYAWYELVQPGQAMRPGEVWKYRLEIDPDGLHIFIVECLAKVYEQQIARLKDRRDEATEEAEMKYFGKILDTFSQYKTKLHNNGFQRGAIEQAVYYFRDRCFTEQLDSYENILGVGNGILKLGKLPKLITGFHEYKISKFTSVNYIPFDANRPSIKLLLSVFADIFPEKDVLLYMLCLASTGLDHYEAANILTILVGGGCNGKTFFMKMVHNALENMYCAVLKPSLLTAPNEKAEAANPALMQMRDKTFGYFDEFQKCEFINIARMKSLTNPGWQSGRDNYEKASNFKNTANLITASNFEFIVDSTDHGTWRRIYHYTMKIKFCEKPDSNNPNEKKINPKLIDSVANDPEYKEAMLSIMTEYNRILHVYYDNDIKNIPVPTIHYETEVFRSKQDSMNKFITTHIAKSPEYEEIISVTTIAAKYRDWYKLNYKRDMSMIEAESQIENSRVGKLLTTLGSIKVLSQHRLRTSPEEPIRNGESLLGIVEPPKQETYELPDFSIIVAPKKQKQQSDILESKYIQNSDHITNDTSVEDILAKIENPENYNIDAV